MKKITFLISLFTITLSFGQNLILDGTFDTQTGGITTATTPWAGFNSQVLGAAASPDPNVGNVNNGEGSIYQVVSVTPGSTYNVKFDYKWVSGTGNYNMTVRLKDNANLAGNLTFTDASDGFVLNTTPDTWYANNTFSVTIPTGVTDVRLLFYKTTGNRPLRMDNVSITLDNTASVKDLSKFNFKSFPNPAKDNLKLTAENNINKVEIYSLLGQQVINKNLDSKNAEVNISNLSKGVYLVKAYIGNAVGTYKFIKE